MADYWKTGYLGTACIHIRGIFELLFLSELARVREFAAPRYDYVCIQSVDRDIHAGRMLLLSIYNFRRGHKTKTKTDCLIEYTWTEGHLEIYDSTDGFQNLAWAVDETIKIF